MRIRNYLFGAALLAGLMSTGLTAVAADATAAKPTLEQIHGSMWPTPDGKWAMKDQCLKCHGSFDKLAEQTKDLVPNPHYSHLGEVDCVACHKADKSEPELVCNTCHKFKIHKKAAN